MAEDVDVAGPAAAPVLDRLPMRDENGEIRREFVEEIARAIHDCQRDPAARNRGRTA